MTENSKNETTKLIDALRIAAAKLPDSIDEVGSLIERLGGTGSIKALEALLPYIWKTTPIGPYPDRSKATYFADEMMKTGGFLARLRRPHEQGASRARTSAAKAVHRLVDHFVKKDLPALDHAIHQLGGYRGMIDIYNHIWMYPWEPVPDEVPEGPERISQLGLIASSSNGYVREAAVKELAVCTTGEELPFLLWRTTDWVEPVRRRAITAIEDRLRPDMLPGFGAAIPLLQKLTRTQRADNTGIVNSICRLMLDEPHQATLASLLNSPDAIVRRESCRVLDRLIPSPRAGIVLCAAGDGDVRVRAYAVRWEAGLRTIDADAARRLQKLFLRDRVPGIRVAALRAIVAVEGEISSDTLKRSLFDQAPTVRQTARYHLNALDPSLNPADVYRNALDGEHNTTAIAGLGETGTPADWHLIEPHLQGQSRHARTALKALVALDPERSHPLLLELLVDEREGVSNDARRHLGYRLPESDAPALVDLWTRTSTPTSAKNAAAATLKLLPWLALGSLLRIIRLSTTDTIEAALNALKLWHPEHHPMYAPAPLSAELRAELLGQLSEVGYRLPEDESKRILKDISLGNRN